MSLVDALRARAVFAPWIETWRALEAWQDRDRRAHLAVHHHYATLAAAPCS
ncbi:hypothetical protein [Phytohabitans houttuyneae]|nr:hypothetical protein [Phytohabitans houttuyneae]